MSLQVHSNLPRQDYKKMVYEIFSSPIDFYDYFLNADKSSFQQIFRIHILLWGFAVLCKILHNLGIIYLIPELLDKEETIIKFYSGLSLPTLLYPFCYFVLFALEGFRKAMRDQFAFQQTDSLAFIAFLPFSASCIFWLFPKPISGFFIIGAFLYSAFHYYKGLRHIDGMGNRIIAKFFLSFFIFLFIFSFLFFSVVGYLRSSI